jgi:hypothetical protein
MAGEQECLKVAREGCKKARKRLEEVRRKSSNGVF